eukprot:15466198-Alexandrium_andersonii.AAC.1
MRQRSEPGSTEWPRALSCRVRARGRAEHPCTAAPGSARALACSCAASQSTRACALEGASVRARSEGRLQGAHAR